MQEAKPCDFEPQILSAGIIKCRIRSHTLGNNGNNAELNCSRYATIYKPLQLSLVMKGCT